MSQELKKVREAITRECDKECPHSHAGAGYDSGPQLCEINDKLCLLESGDNCSIWNNIKIDRIVEEMPKAKNPVKQEKIDWYKEHWGNKENNTCAFCDANLGIGYNAGSIEQCHLLAEAGYRKPIEPIPQHCSEHRSFQDDCQGCQGVTSQYKYIRPGIPNKYNAGNGEYKEIDWGSFHLGQEMMLNQGYRKVNNKEKMVAILWEFMKTSGNRHTIEEDANFIIERLLENNNE